MNTRRKTFRTLTLSSAAALTLLAGTGASSAQCTGNKLAASDAAAFDGFGASIALDNTAGGPIAVIGASGDDNAQGHDAGAVYIFSRPGAAWGQTAKLFSSTLDADDGFGHAVAYDDPYLIVGAPGVDGVGLGDSGAFFMYERSGNTWTPRGRYLPAQAGTSAAGGWSVDVTTANGGRAIVGAPDADFDGNSSIAGDQNPQSGVASIYERLADGSWAFVTYITDFNSAGSGANQHLGQAVAIAGDVAVIGAPNGKAPGKPNLSGYVKILRHTIGGGWTVTGPSRLSPADAEDTDLFGSALDTDGTMVAVGALNHDSTAAQTPRVGATFGAGCVYIYRWNSSTSQFDLDGQLFADDASSGMQLGGTVKVSGGKVFAGSYATHKVYCFRRLGANNWTQEYVLNDAEPGPQSGFASDFAAAGDAVIVGDAIDTRGALTYTGAAFAYTIANSDAGNDSCNAAKDVAAGNHAGCTLAATRDGFSTCGNSIDGQGADVWYAWTPGCSGNVIIDTYGSDYDTVLSIHTGCPDGGAGGNLHEVTCSDDAANFGLASLVTFNYTAGTRYLVRVSGYNGAAGNYVVRINDYAPASSNNDCSTPQTVTSGNTYTWANCKATADGPSTTGCAGAHVVNDVWFRFTPPVAGTLALDTCGSNFDTVMTMYWGSTCPVAAQEVACNDDPAAGSPCPAQGRTSSISYGVLAHLPYMIRVGGYDSTSPNGDGVLHVNFTAACPCDWNQSGQVSVQDIFDFLSSYFSGAGDFNHSGATSVQDIFDFLACYFAGCP